MIFIVIALGVFAAAATIVIAVRLVPPVRDPMALPANRVIVELAHRLAGAQVRSENEAALQAEVDTRDEIDSLRQMMLQQRLEIAQLRREARTVRREIEPITDPRAQDLDLRKRRAGLEARQLGELPVGSVERVASS